MPTSEDRLAAIEAEARLMRTDLEEGLRHAQHASLCLTSFSRRMSHLEDAIIQARAEDAETALWLDEMLSRTQDRCEGNMNPAPTSGCPRPDRRDEI